MATPASSDAFAALPMPAKIAIGVGLLVMASAGYVFAFHLPIVDEIDDAEARRTRLQVELREAEQRQDEFQRLVELLQGREAGDRRNNQVLPEEAEIAAFLEDLTRTAELSGLAMRLVEPRPEEAEPLYTRIPVSLRLVGRYHQVAKFFYNVSRLDRAIGMENIALEFDDASAEDESEALNLEVRVLATAFRRSNAPATSAPAQPGNPRRAGGGR